MTDPMDPTPLYVQVANLLEARIKAGEWAPRTPIPGEGQIQQQYDVARVTARAAVRVLRERGLVVTIPQRGSYVVDRTDG